MLEDLWLVSLRRLNHLSCCDLRHHFISALAQTQTPDATIQAISGHLSRKMLEHYSHVRLEAKRRAVETLDAIAAMPVQ